MTEEEIVLINTRKDRAWEYYKEMYEAIGQGGVMDEQQALEQQLRSVERQQHELWERGSQLDAFLSESLALMVNNCVAQQRDLKKRRDQLADKADSIRLQLRKLGGPDWKCTCPEFIHTGQCDHMERVNELVSREEN